MVARRSEMLARPPGIGPTLILGSLSINILTLALPLVLLQIFDRIVPNKAVETLTALFCGLVIALSMEFVLKVCRIVLLGYASAEYETQMTAAALRKVLDADSYAYSQDSVGTHVDRMVAIGQLRDHHGGQGRLLSIDMPFTILFVVMIWYIGGWLVVVPIGCLALIVVVSLMIRLLQAPVIAQRQSVDRRRNSFMIEVLSRMPTVKGLSAEQQMLRRFERLQDQAADATRGLIWVASLSQTFGAFAGQAAVIAMGAVGAYLNIIGMIGMAELAACMLLNGRTIQPMLKLLGLWAQVESVRAAENRVNELAMLPAPKHGYQYDGTFEPRLMFDKVTLHPKGRAEPVFENLNFSVEPGQIAAIIGPDGGGKSSVMRMILGEQRPTSGRVRIDRDNPLGLMHRREIGEIAYVDQDPVIFRGTILENMSLFGDRARQDAALHVAQRIGLEAEILRMPMGYETEIGPGAQAVLPLGTLQKICIARVLGRRPLMLLFNNAASAIDGRTREQVAAAITALRGQTTVILVSRRLLDASQVDLQVDLAPAPAPPVESASIAAWLQDAEEDRAPIRLCPAAQVAS